jgi:hypothetical protein
MSEIKDGGPAFPCDEQIRDSMTYQPEPGLSIRDYFAAKAMAGMRSNSAFFGEMQDDAVSYSQRWISFDIDLEIARLAYQQADAMLRARGAA